MAISMEAPTDRLVSNLGNNIRFLRDKRGLTQAKLAQLCNLPRSTVASIETGTGNPTLSVLTSLAASLQLSIQELLSEPQTPCKLFARGTLPMLRKGRSGKTVVHKLLPFPIPGMEMDRFELSAGDRIVGVPHRANTHEYLYCERGEIGLAVGGKRYELHPGDLVAFPGDQPHSYNNPTQGISVGFSVVALSPIGIGT